MVSAAPFENGEFRCENEEEGYAIAFPADWIVHPGNPAGEVPSCHYFGPRPFELEYSESADLWSVDVGIFEGGCLEFDVIQLPVRVEEVSVAGYPAFRAHTGTGDYAYILNLRADNGPVLMRPGDEDPPGTGGCSGARGLMVAGRAWGPAQGEALRDVVDRITVTLEIADD